MNKAIEIIHDEHLALAAVLQGMSQLLIISKDKKVCPDFDLLTAMVKYITDVPEQLHHPKEDRYIFSLLKTRCSNSIPVIDLLEKQHKEGPERTVKLKKSLSYFIGLGISGLEQFSQELKVYMDQEWHHMNTEEDVVLPLAREFLTPDDWAGIYTAFVENGNPWQGLGREYDKLFTKIVSLTPPPLGVGPEIV